MQPNGDKPSEDRLKLDCCELNFNPDVDTPSSGVYLSNADSEPSSSFTIELGKTEAERSNALARYQYFHKWAWSECFTSSKFCALKYGHKRAMQLLRICEMCHNSYFFEDNHCSFCHISFRNSDISSSFSDHVAACEHKLESEPCETVHHPNALP